MKKPLLAQLIAALICQTAFAAEEPTAKLAEEIGTHVGFMHGWKLTPKLTLDYCIQAYPSNADTLRGEYAKWVSANKAQIILVDEYFANFIPFFASLVCRSTDLRLFGANTGADKHIESA